MTNELLIEERVPLKTLAKELGVSRRTLMRWAIEGYRGQRLENYRIGRKRYSTRPAATRFLAAMNDEMNSEMNSEECGEETAIAN